MACCPFLGGDSVVVVYSLFVVAPIVCVFCECSLFYVVILAVLSIKAIILLKKIERVAILYCDCLCLRVSPHGL